MARRDVIQYFLEVENEYVETQETVKELQQLALDGKVEESTYLTAKENIDIIKQNYERIAYIIFLLNKPNRKEKAKYDESVNKAWYDYLKSSSKEAIVDESKDALAEFKKMVRSLKDEQ